MTDFFSRRPHRTGRGAAVGVLLLASCQPAAGRFRTDPDPPRLVGTSLSEGRALGITEPIRLRFSSPVDPASLDSSSVVVVPFELRGPCTGDPECGGDRCHRGRCQHDPVDAAWLADLANRPLTPARLARTAPAAVHVDAEGDVVWEPWDPLASHRLHALLAGPGIVDIAGTPVAVAAGSRIILEEVFVSGAEDTGRPLLALEAPVDGAALVPTNLRRVLVTFSRPVLGVEADSLFLRRADSARVAARIEERSDRCATRPLGTCFELRPLAPLPARERLEVGATESIRDLRGRSVLLGRAPWFTTAAQADHDRPDPGVLRVQVSDRCVVVRAHLEERADLHLRPHWAVPELWSLARDVHEVVLSPPAGAPGSLGAALEDLAGNRAELPLTIVPAGDGSPRVVITEVLAHPAGPEPDQEFVELLNLESAPVSLAGWSLHDGEVPPESHRLPAVTLDPGQLALVVGSKFDLARQDPPVAAGAPLVRLGQTLGKNGLANTGEPLWLRDQEGRLVSSYQGTAPGPLRKGRSVERIDVGGCDLAANWRHEPDGRSTPGWLPATTTRAE